MSEKQRYLCVFYGLTALAALLVTWSQLTPYYGEANDLASLGDGFLRYFDDLRINPAARSIAADMLVLGLGVSTFMILEARRLGMSYVWVYILLGFFIAAGFAFPLFMIARERHLAWHEGARPDDAPEKVPLADGLGFAVVSAIAVCVGGLVLMGG